MQARPPLWGANVGRIFTQKISRPRSHSFTRVRNLHFIQHDQSPPHSAFTSFGLPPFGYSTTGSTPYRANLIRSTTPFGISSCRTRLHRSWSTGPTSPISTHHRTTIAGPGTTGPNSNISLPNEATTGPTSPPNEPRRTRQLPVQIASARAHQQLYTSKTPAPYLIL